MLSKCCVLSLPDWLTKFLVKDDYNLATLYHSTSFTDMIF